MKKLLSGVCAASLALAVTATGMAPAYAAPLVMPQNGPPSNVIKVQGSEGAYDENLKLRRERITREIQRKRNDDGDEARGNGRRERREENREAMRDRRDDASERRDERRRVERDRREDWRDDQREARDDRRDRREYRRDDDDRDGYYRGYRGYRDYRPGYKRHGDFWYPAAAFVAGALITGAIANSQPREVIRDTGDAHAEWCANRYRSYRAYDDTFQPYNGPRQQCISPYD